MRHFFCVVALSSVIYTLSLHDALPISTGKPAILTFEGGYHGGVLYFRKGGAPLNLPIPTFSATYNDARSEEHTSELQSPCNLVCRLLLEKKNKKKCHLMSDRYKEIVRA